MKVIISILVLVFAMLGVLCHAAAVGDYRSRINNGDWDQPTSWEICTASGDPGTWETASVAPNEEAGVITITSGKRINMILNQTADQIVIASGGSLRIYNNQVLTLKNGAGDDFDIQTGGTLELFGNIYTEASTNVQISGTYMDVENCQIQGLGAVTVAANATINTRNGFGIHLFGETIRGCFAVTDRTMDVAANYIFSSTLDPQFIHALPGTVNNLIASNTSEDSTLVILQNALSANAVTVTSGALVLGGDISLNTLTLNDNILHFATHYAYFNNQHISVGGKPDSVTALTVAEDVISTHNMGSFYGNSIPRTWTTSAAHTNPLNVILHYPDALISTEKVFVWTRDTDSTSWNLYGEYTPVIAEGIEKVTVYDVASLNNSTENGTLDWTISAFVDPVLPVELSSFTCVATAQNFVKLEWVTQSENNLSGYYIYRNNVNNVASALRINAFIQATNTSNQVGYSFLDQEAVPGNTWFYWLQYLDMSGETEVFGPITITLPNSTNPPPPIPLLTSLKAIFPNPFNPQTAISYGLAKAAYVSLVVINGKGAIVRNLYAGNKNAGSYITYWDGNNDNGRRVASGVYYLKMQAGKYVTTRKMVLMK